MIRDRHYIDGQWVAPSSEQWIEVLSPHDGQMVGRVVAGSIDDIDDAVMAARKRLPAWSALPPSTRADYLERMAEHLATRVDELAHLIVGEVGTPIRVARRVQVELPIRNLRSHAVHVREFPFAETVANSLVLREPVGVVAAITPWNYPLHQAVLKVAAAMAAGCTVVLKPSEVTPLNAFFLADAAHAAQLPPGVLNVVTGSGKELGETLITHPEVDKISFTGSTATGSAIAALAARSIKRVTLELGGKSAAVLLDTADIERAVRHTVGSCLLNSGQTCTALTRLLVPASEHDRVADMAARVAAAMSIGDPRDESTRIGPLTSRAQFERVQEWIRAGVASGATQLTGDGKLPEGIPACGNYVRPTVFGNVHSAMAIAREEIFGPVLCVMPYTDPEDALAIAEDTQYGLAGSIWSADIELATSFARRMRTGQIDINGGAFNPDAPFGGFKQSGYGREAGVYGLEDFLEFKTLQLPA